MTASKFTSTKAIILNRQNYSEADKILQLLTPTGRISVIARGVRKQRSKLVGGTQLFAVNDVTYLQGRGEMQVLTSSRLDIFYENIIKDYDRMQIGYNVIKLIYQNSGSADSGQWFDILEEVLTSLNDQTVDTRLTETWFYLRFSELLGYELGLQYDSSGKKIVADQNYYYDVSEKGLTPSRKGEITANHIKLMRILIANPLGRLHNISGLNEIINDCLMTARAHASI